jgi:hypothetical protein
MIKLKEIISQLDSDSYSNMETALQKSKADNFLFLIKSYRKGNLNDEDIIKELKLNSNSFYVLKSRLYDKIQKQIAGEINLNKEYVLTQLQQIPDMCYATPRETAIAFLQKLEKELLEYDMHNELLQVYSALKKIHVNSDRYFYYSQLYNKHIAYGLSVEKAEEILGNFNRILAQYDFSKSKDLLEKLLFLRKEISDHNSLNASRQIEIIKNIIDLQMSIFCDPGLVGNCDVIELLSATRKKTDELPGSDYHKKWGLTIDYLSFEYYKKTSPAKADQYFEKVNEQFSSLLLYNNVCLTSRFLISKIRYLQDKNKTDRFEEEKDLVLLFDPHDTYTKVQLGIYNAMVAYYAGNLKSAIGTLNDVINLYSFKDYFHVNMEIKFTLSFFYMCQKNNDLAEIFLKSIYRKIKSEELEHYDNALDFIKTLSFEVSNDSSKKALTKQKEAFTLFMARNVGTYELLNHLQPELKKKYFDKNL